MQKLSTVRRAGLFCVATAMAAGCGSLGAVAPTGAPAASSFPVVVVPTIGHLTALDATTGTPRWKVVLPIATVSAPVTAAGVVVVAGTRDCKLPYLTVVAYQLATGKQAWRVPVPTADPCGYVTPLHLAAGVIVAGGPIQTTQGLTPTCSAKTPRSTPALGLDPATGRRRWTEPASGGAILGVTSSVVVTDGTGFPCLSGFAASTGKTRWSRPDPQGQPDLTAAGAGFFQTGYHGKDAIIALDPATGHPRWRRSVSGTGFYDYLVVSGSVVADVATKSVFMTAAQPAAAPAAAASASAGPAPVFRGPTERTVVTAFDVVTGHPLWRKAYAEDTTEVNAGSNALLVLHQRRPGPTKVEALQVRTGARLWLSNPPDGQQLTANIAPSRVDVTLATLLTGRVATGLDAATGHVVWSSPTTADSAFTAGGSVFLELSAQPKNPHLSN